MSEATATVETPEAPKTESPAKPRPQPKGSKKPAAATAKASKTNPKAPAKGKGSKATVAKASRPRKEGLREPQIRILKALSKKGGLTRAEVAKKAEVDPAFCTTWIGSLKEDLRTANEEKRGIKSLLGLKYVRPEQHDINGKDVVQYFITKAGTAAMEKASK